VDIGDWMRRDSIDLRHAFDFRERDLIADIKQMTSVGYARH